MQNHPRFYRTTRFPGVLTEDFDNDAAAKGMALLSDQLGVSMNGSRPFGIAMVLLMEDLTPEARLMEQAGVYAITAVMGRIKVKIDGCSAVHSNPAVLQAGTWFVLTITFDGTELSFYINNVPVGGGPLLRYGGFATSIEPHCAGLGFAGQMRLIQVYERNIYPDQLRPDWLDFRYTDDRPAPDGLVQYFDFSCCETMSGAPIEIGAKVERIGISGGIAIRGQGQAVPQNDGSVSPGNGIDAYTVQSWLRVLARKTTAEWNALCSAYPTQLICADIDQSSNGAGMSLSIAPASEAPGCFGLTLVHGSGTCATILATDNQVINGDRWYNIAVTYDGVATLCIYIDGALAATGQITQPIGTLSMGGAFTIGGALLPVDGAYVNSFQGTIVTVEVWGVALTQAQIVEYAGFSPAVGTPGLTGLYDFAQIPAANMQTYAPVAFLGEVAIVNGNRHRLPSDNASSEEQAITPRIFQTFDGELAARLRSLVDNEAVRKKHRQGIAVVRSRLAAMPADTFGLHAAKRYLDRAHAAVETNIFDLPGGLQITQELNGHKYLVLHEKDQSFVIGEINESLTICQEKFLLLSFDIIVLFVGFFSPALSGEARGALYTQLTRDGQGICQLIKGLVSDTMTVAGTISTICSILGTFLSNGVLLRAFQAIISTMTVMGALCFGAWFIAGLGSKILQMASVALSAYHVATTIDELVKNRCL